MKLCFAEDREIGYHSLHRGGVSGCVPSHEPAVKIEGVCQEGRTWTKAGNLPCKERKRWGIFDVTYLHGDICILVFFLSFPHL